MFCIYTLAEWAYNVSFLYLPCRKRRAEDADIPGLDLVKMDVDEPEAVMAEGIVLRML